MIALVCRDAHKSSGETATEKRYYISSHRPDAELINKKVREHWAIENNQHWVLDAQLGEDRSKKHSGNQAENCNILLKAVMTILGRDKTKKLSVKRKRMKAALDQSYREKLIKM